ncbi:MAG TPA: hypothetical protein VND89_09495 [Acidimicrobiales bacterium]|nr:hypothetical protein [Acidimicrobiales bacterium]
MTEGEHDEAVARGNLTLDGASAERPSLDGSVKSLRGAEAVSVGRGFWLFLGAIGLMVFAAVLVVSFISATNDNARIERMKTHGIAVTVTAVDCVGNIGGSGSNAAGYTCRGDYTVDATTYHEVIGSMTTFSAPGTTVHAMADPSKLSSVLLASAVRTSVSSPGAYLAPGLLAVVLIVLTLAFLRIARRPKSPRRRSVPERSPEP